MAKKRLDQLDGMRFFMNWMIIISHFEFLDDTVFHQYVLHSSLAVNYFFMLSGFGLYYSMYLKDYQKPQGKAEGLKFALGKVKKLYVPYVICLILCAFYRIVTRMSTYGLLRSVGITGMGFVIDLTMLQSLVPNKTIAHGINEVMAGYRVSIKSLSSNKLKAVIGAWKLYKREIPKIGKRMICYTNYLKNAIKRRV